MRKKDMAAIGIDVTPLFRQGNQIICGLEPPPGNHKGGMLWLGKNDSGTLQFNLQAGEPKSLAFRADHNGNCEAFWWSSDDCPRQNNGCPPPYSNPRISNNGQTLTIDVGPVPENSAAHYRLNFDNNCFFDPIIIRD